jgi:hypothetical protein
VVTRHASEAEQYGDQLQFAAALLNVEHRHPCSGCLKRKARRGFSGATVSEPTVKLACDCKMSLRRNTQNRRDHDPIRPATERRAGLRNPCGGGLMRASPTGVYELRWVVPPLTSGKGERDPDTYCREPAYDRGEPNNFASFIED